MLWQSETPALRGAVGNEGRVLSLPCLGHSDNSLCVLHELLSSPGPSAGEAQVSNLGASFDTFLSLFHNAQFTSKSCYLTP